MTVIYMTKFYGENQNRPHLSTFPKATESPLIKLKYANMSHDEGKNMFEYLPQSSGLTALLNPSRHLFKLSSLRSQIMVFNYIITGLTISFSGLIQLFSGN